MFAGLGELIEFLAGASGSKEVGGSNAAALGTRWLARWPALLPGWYGFGVPIVGNVIASVVGSALGRWWARSTGNGPKASTGSIRCKVGSAAFIGRILGHDQQADVRMIMLIIFLAAIWI